MRPSREPCEPLLRANRRSRFIGALRLFAIAVGASYWYGAPSLTIRDISSATQQQQDYRESQRRLTDNKPLRILYIVTSVAEFNNGRRFTTRGDDRVVKYMMPVLTEGVESMLSFGYQVDVYLICHWKMTPKRREMIRSQLPASAGLEVWDDATPLGYRVETDHNHTEPVTRGLARQHRYVIKDKLLDYDFFVVFEDDMLVKGDHVKHYLEMTNEISRLRALAPGGGFVSQRKEHHAPLSKVQLSRMIPGLVRVEVLRTEDQYGAQNASEMDPITVDLEFDGVNRTVDPRPCCHLSNKTVNDHIPPAPPSNKLMVWETGIKGLSVYQLPNSQWVALLGGSHGFTRKTAIGSYWSGRDGAFGDEGKPESGDARFLNNQGGWMATRQQIWEWHSEHCQGGLLPPFNPPHFPLDGLDLRNVEYWSGGIHIFSYYKGCNMQRIVSLDPDGFSQHLVYHSANNKQRQLTARGKRERFVKVDNLLGQLNTVKKNAEKATRKETSKIS